jgi:beta-glucanase (GH16 family)
MDIKIKLLSKHKILDVLVIYWGLLKAEIKYWTFRKGSERKILTPKNYSLNYGDSFDGPLNKEMWRYAMPWGDFHPNHLYQWYDSNGQLSYTNNGHLSLWLKNKPKKYVKSELPEWRQAPRLPESFTIPTGTGFISTKKTWQYGWFESWIKLPKGKSYWPAFWMSGLATWPPEIDVFEAFSHRSKKYSGGLFNLPYRSIQPNLHYGVVEDGTKTQYTPYNVPIADATERYVQYVCHWEKDFIRIYYDGTKIFECTDPKILSWYNRENAQQYVILNHGLHKDYPQNPDESEMTIKEFKVYQKNGI